jgi:hypothetical protein
MGVYSVLRRLALRVPPIARLYDDRNALLARLESGDRTAAIARQRPTPIAYEQIASEIFGQCAPAPNTWPATSFTPSGQWGQLIAGKMKEVEFELARHLLVDIRDTKVAGAIVEFGVADGAWLEQLVEICGSLGMQRDFVGFDSFEGLPEPGTADQGLGWEKGMFAAPYDAVCQRLRVAARPNLHLIKGWFEDTTRLPEALAVKRVAYARIDGDLYESAVDSLEWLSGRLSNKAILVFDDWTFDPNTGETKAFFEWAPATGYRFELLGHLGIGALYMRIHHA